MGEAEQPKRARDNPLVVLVMIVVICGCLFIIIKGIFFPPNLASMLGPPELVAQDLGPMDLAWSVQQLDGPPMDMAQLKGKVVFLNFWEHWCPPCVAEMPSIQPLRQKLEGADVVVLPVFREDPSATRKFVAGHGITMPVYQVVGPLPADVAAEEIPTTYIIGRDGQVVVKETGAATWDDDSVVAFLRGLEAKESP